jgi:lysophospholipid acyltransferase (LPLAT)-like uncharacterized protein
VRKYFLGPLVWLIYKLISLTWRVSTFEPAEMLERIRQHQPTIFAHWHGDEIVLISLLRRYRVATIASTSKDGEMMNTVIHLLGGKTSRGSSTRGAVGALKGLVRLVKSEGRNSSFAVDGPKGPLHKAKPGVFELSRLVDAPIYAVGVACDRAWRFEKSWNKTYFPKPFARLALEWTAVLPAITKAEDPRSETLALTLEAALQRQQALAAKKIASR